MASRMVSHNHHVKLLIHASAHSGVPWVAVDPSLVMALFLAKRVTLTPTELRGPLRLFGAMFVCSNKELRAFNGVQLVVFPIRS